MTAVITQTLKKQFIQDLFKDIQDSATNYYIAIGRSQTWNDSDVAPNPTISQREERNMRLDMQSMKLVEDFSFVVPRTTWTSGAIYDAYDDQITTNTSGNPYYVITDVNNVYICVRQSRNASGVIQTSSVQPTGTSVNAFTTSDGYAWKFLYSIPTLTASKFLSANFMPVKLQGILDSDGAGNVTSLASDVEQKTIQDAATAGPIVGFTVTNQGAGYTSAPTVNIIGDGTGARALATVQSGVVTKIDLDDSTIGALNVPVTGSGYKFANITFTGGGSPTTIAEARPIFGPTAGFGADPRDDLRSRALMFNSKPTGEEGGEFVVGNSFRRISVIRNPKEPDSAVSGGLFISSAGNALRRLKLSSGVGNTFTVGLVLTGGSSAATAIIDKVDSDEIWYHQTETTGFTQFQEGEAVSDEDAGTATLEAVGVDADSDAYIKPTVDPFSGEVLYIENRAKIDRSADQTEDIKVIIEI